MPVPLSGIRVVDLSRVLAGPGCTMMLGDLGASVIKVERPDLGDDTRGWGPPFDPSGRSAYFLSVNRNKLSIALDFRQPEDVGTLLALIGNADVVVENYLPGALARCGIDKALELARNRKLIWCTISGFGPDSNRPGYDFVVQAEAGWMSITGEVAGQPMKVGVALVDVLSGKDAAVAILGALVGRTGEDADRDLHVSLSGSATAALVNVAQNTLVSGQNAKRWGNAHPNLVPYQLFDAADRPLVIAVGTDAQWLTLCTALGLNELTADKALATNAGRLAGRNLVVAQISARVAQHPAAHWISALAAAGVPCGLVRTVGEALDETDASRLTGVCSAVGGSVRYPPPSLNEHGDLIRKKHWSAFDHVPILESRLL